MSTLSVTTVTTGLSTTDLTLNTANTSAGDVIIKSDGLGIVLSGNSTTNTISLAPNGQVSISNSTVNTFILTRSGSMSIASNTLALGTSLIGSAGFTNLTNDLKINWGFITANNSTGGNATFSSAFTIACFGVMTSGANSVANISWVNAVNTTVAQIRSGNATATGGNVYYIAYGV